MLALAPGHQLLLCLEQGTQHRVELVADAAGALSVSPLQQLSLRNCEVSDPGFLSPEWATL